MQEQGIVLFRDNFEHVRSVLSFEQKGILLDALFDGKYDGGDPLVQMAFNLFYAGILRSAEKYEATCAKNRENALHKWQLDKENKEKAKAYDRMQANATASDGMRSNATGTGAGTGAGVVSNKSRFVPPRFEEVEAYCRERGNKIDPNQFYDWNQARGWQLRKGVPMRDWRAAVRTWERNAEGRGTKNGTCGSSREDDRVPGSRDLYVL